MNYQDALNLKNSKKENPFWKNGIEYVWMVVPSNPIYLEEYAKDYFIKDDLVEDQTAKKYAKDELYDIHALRMKK